MSSITIPRTLAAAAVTVAVAAVLLTRGRAPGDDPLVTLGAADRAATQSAASTFDAASTDANETPAAAKLRELDALSETYRNTTFLIAIRDSGFVCEELLGVYGGINNSATWTATCSQMLAYTVRVASSGTLRVEPMLQHVDSIGPQPAQPRELGGEPGLPPQELRPQQR